MFTEIIQLKASQARIQRLEDHVLVEYGYRQDSKVEFQKRDRLPRRQWKALLEAIKGLCQFENNQDGCLIGTLILVVGSGNPIAFSVQIDEAAGRIELTIKD